MYDKLEDLIVHLTGLHPSSGNYRIAVEFALSNFKYHTFLDVNSPRVRRNYDGLVSKFSVHSQLKKSEALKDCLKRFLKCPLKDEEEAGYATEDHFRLLQLLLELSDNPTSSDYEERDFRKEEDNSTDEWIEELVEQSDDLECIDESDELSDWSEESDAEDYGNKKEVILTPNVHLAAKNVVDEVKTEKSKDKSRLELDTVELPERGVLKPLGNSNSEATYSRLSKNQYWNSPPICWKASHGKTFDSEEKREDIKLCVFNLLCLKMKEVEPSLEKSFPCSTISELNTLREVIWMLNGSEDLFVFESKEIESVFCPSKSRLIYAPRHSIQIGHMSPGLLETVLAELCLFGNNCALLADFVSSATTFSTNSEHPILWLSQTYQAFACVIQTTMNEFRIFLSRLEKDLIECPSSLSLLSFQFLVKEWERKVGTLYEALENCVLAKFPVTREGFSTGEASVSLLNYLYGNAAASSYSNYLTKFNSFVFKGTAKPYMSMIEEWMSSGSVTDKYEEFFIVRNFEIDVENANFWEKGFSVRGRKQNGLCVNSRDVLVPQFLKCVSGKLFLAGKTCHVLWHLMSRFSGNKKLKKVLEFDWNLPSLQDDSVSETTLDIGKLYELQSFRKWLNLCEEGDLHCFKANCNSLCEVNVFSGFPSADYFDVIKPLVNGMIVSEKKNLCNTDLSVQNMQSSFKRNLLMYSSQYNSLVLCILQEMCDIKIHFRRLRCFFLMAAGDVMHQFSTSIFGKIIANEFWKDTYVLNVLFQEAITSVYYHDSKSVSFSLKEGAPAKGSVLVELDSVLLCYNAEWPLNIFISPFALECYSRIFSLLLKIKFVKFVLENSWGDHKSTFVMKRACDYSDSANKNAALHSFYLLGSDLLHFVNNLYSYVMGRILLVGAKDFLLEVDKSSSIDEVLNAHNKFVYQCVQRCLLTKSTGVIMNGITKVLELSITYSECWGRFENGDKKLRDESTEKCEQIQAEYKRCKQFLVSLLNNVVKRGSTDHLSYLAMSLGSNHACP